jgi:hypothetical protein
MLRTVRLPVSPMLLLLQTGENVALSPRMRSVPVPGNASADQFDEGAGAGRWLKPSKMRNNTHSTPAQSLSPT